MLEQFSLIPVTRTVVTRREHPNVSLFFTKKGDLVFLFSPEFLASDDHMLALGSKVLCGYAAGSGEFLITPAEEGRSNARTIGKRPGFKGAGQLVIPCRNLPEGITPWEGRITAATTCHEGSVVVDAAIQPLQ